MDNQKLIIQHSSSAREALRKLDELAKIGSVLFVINEQEQVVGTITDGDIRRGLLNNLNITDAVSLFMNSSFKFLDSANYSTTTIKELRAIYIRFVPLLDANKKLLQVLDLSAVSAVLPLDAVIMAGGVGKRLRPLTDNIPKPLLKVGDKTIIEHNIDRLASFGIRDFHITIKYLGEKIKEHLGNGISKNISIEYISEAEPLGTVGAVGLIKSFNHEHVLIMNSDLLTNIDFEDFYKSFLDTKADMAVATIPYHVDIPYAVMEIKDTNEVQFFKEKPRYTYYSNAGIYLLKKELLKLIPDNTKFDATDLMNLVINSTKKLISYPILTYWLDIGQHEDYRKALEDIKHLNLK